jgi:hypothetical protein
VSDPITELRRAIDCLPVVTREAMLEGIRSNPIVVGAYTDDRGGICPMLAAHRHGGRTTLLAFARSWDRFARARGVRRATRRELAVLEAHLTSSLMAEAEVDLKAAIADHEALRRRHRVAETAAVPEISARRLRPRRADAERALARLDRELARL